MKCVDQLPVSVNSACASKHSSNSREKKAFKIKFPRLQEKQLLKIVFRKVASILTRRPIIYFINCPPSDFGVRPRSANSILSWRFATGLPPHNINETPCTLEVTVRPL